MVLPNSLNKAFEQSMRLHWNMPALSDYKGETFTYKHVATEIEKLHIVFEACGIQHGDKIALCGRNQSRWAIAFLATLTYGAVAVPVLHEFHPEQVHAIVNHSEAKLLFVGDLVWPKLDAEAMPALTGIICNRDYSVLVSRDPRLAQAMENSNQLFGERHPNAFTADDMHYYEEDPEDLAVINYTSGTTSNSKGVMIPFRAVWSNCKFAHEIFGDHCKAGDNLVSMLPMAHTFGMSFEFIYEFCNGLHISILTKTPSPRILLQAFHELQPVALVCVPLIIEKIVRKAILPKISKPHMKVLLRTPIVGRKIKDKIRQGLLDALGGNVYEVVIGGSALNHEIETLLHDIHFPYTVGFGATECSPIICYEDWKYFALGSCGKAVPRMEVQIDSPDPINIPGEILARGMNVMLGYYKNEEATAETLRDGWYHTGDLGVMDAQGNVFIKGRSKNMLLGSNGQNIYPEEIEDKLNSMPLVCECVVIQEGEKLAGLVYPDPEQVEKQHLTPEDVKTIMNDNLVKLNATLPNYEKLTELRIRNEEFEKTPKRSIKRYLYTK